MCRLLAFHSFNAERTLQQIMGPRLEEFRQLSRLHSSGWGFAGFSQGKRVLYRSIKPAWQDSEFTYYAALPVSRAMLHFRFASPNMAIAIENVHPFTDESLAFAHNGFFPIEDAPPGRRGETDSEAFFLMVKQRISQGQNPKQALSATIEQLQKDYPDRSFNCLLLHADGLLAAKASVQAKVNLTPDDLRLHTEQDYYTLYQHRTEDFHLVLSSGTSTAAQWEIIEQDKVFSL